MISPRWFLTDRARFSIITYNEKQYMICYLNTVNREVQFVEEVESGKRVVPSQQDKSFSSEKIIENLIERI